MSKAKTPSQNPAEDTKTDNTTVETPAGDIKIDNVNQSLWQFIKKRKLVQILACVPLAVVWEVFAIVLIVKIVSKSSGNNSSGNQSFGYLVAAPFILFSYWFYRLKKQFEDAFLGEFAMVNHYSFNKTGTVDETYGSIFRLQGNQSVSDVVTGSYDGNDLRLFLYELVVGSGRYQRHYNDTVIELDLHGQLPELLLVNKKSNYGQLSLNSSFGVKNTIQLEGDFNQYFTLFGPKGNEIEALEVFSPDTMALMEDESKHYTVEFAGNRIYIYCNGFITTTEQLNQVFALAKKLISKIAPLATRLQNDSAIIATPTNIIKQRKQHPLFHKVGLILSVALGVIGFTVMVWAGFFAPQPAPNTTSNYYSGSTAPSYVTAADQSQAIAVINQYLDALGRNDAQAAYSLTTTKWQSYYGSEVGLSDYKGWNINGFDRSVSGQTSGVDSDGVEWVDVVYKYTNLKDVFYVKMGAEKSNLVGDWRIDFSQGDTKLLNP